MTNFNLNNLLSKNEYPGRGIVVGKTADGENAVIAYFIMGRSQNSRNRVFIEQKNGDLLTAPHDVSKLEDPSLIIYAPLRSIENHVIVTNGDQTDTVYDFVAQGKTFSQALETREFEPDRPNFTPRISAMLTMSDNDFTYQMSILKSADEEGSACNRFTYNYAPINGIGHFLHTYACNGNPLPTFEGEPERITLGNDIDALANEIWFHLNSENKISLYVRFINLKTGKVENRLFNRYQ
jgi:hypothetical protein